ncbi:MAG: hypothetical protein RXQ96_08705 [Thermocladium sp.]|jgi:hypothetical protein
MNKEGQGSVISTVILVSTMLVVSAILFIYAMFFFTQSVSNYSISYVASFLTNVADDIDTFMLTPGSRLTYNPPNTNYGSYNLELAPSANCSIFVTYSNETIINETSGILVYGVPPQRYSLPSGYIYIWRGSNSTGGPSQSISDFSLIVMPHSYAPMATVMALIQGGYNLINGITYGTYIAMLPRVVAINGSTGNGVGYIYIPVIVPIHATDSTVNSLVVYIMNTESTSINNGEATNFLVKEDCTIGNQELSSLSNVSGNSVYVTVIYIGIS